MSCFTEESNKPHFIIVPHASQGHLIPMVDMGHILSERGIHVSLIITRGNADRIRPIINGAKLSKLSIEFVELSFPNAKFGLPSGCESFDHIMTNVNYMKALADAIGSLDEPLEAFIKSLERPPNCMITDLCNGWTAQVARKFDIPRIIFNVPSAFYLSLNRNLFRHKVFDGVTDENEYVTVPNFPVKLEVTKSQEMSYHNFPGIEDVIKNLLDEELTSDGVVINTFLELERPFVENFEKVIGKKVWTMGPFCLYHKDVQTKMGRGNKEAIDQTDRILTWLKVRDIASVLYISFGSIAYSHPQQLMEIGRGLEASNKPFIWVIKKTEMNPEFENWLSEGFEVRTKDRGLIIIGWAPQMVILSHPAVGAFLTHCGWNSTVEAISTGVPMITWPQFADQFSNEKLVVNILKIGVSLGVDVPNYATKDVVKVKSDEIRKAVSALLDGGTEAHERRQRSKDFSEKAKKAMEKGGSSYMNFSDFIHYFTEPEARQKMKNEH